MVCYQSGIHSHIYHTGLLLCFSYKTNRRKLNYMYLLQQYM